MVMIYIVLFLRLSGSLQCLRMNLKEEYNIWNNYMKFYITCLVLEFTLTYG